MNGLLKPPPEMRQINERKLGNQGYLASNGHRIGISQMTVVVVFYREPWIVQYNDVIFNDSPIIGPSIN